MDDQARRWDTSILAGAFALALAALGIAVWPSAANEFGFLTVAPRLLLVVGLVLIPMGLASYSLLTHRPAQLARAGAMAFVAAVFIGVAGLLLAPAGILWTIVASRRGTPFILDTRMAATLALWLTASLVSLAIHEDPLCVQKQAVTACTDDAIVWWEAALAMFIGGLAIIVATGGKDGSKASSRNQRPWSGAPKRGEDPA